MHPPTLLGPLVRRSLLYSVLLRACSCVSTCQSTYRTDLHSYRTVHLGSLYVSTVVASPAANTPLFAGLLLNFRACLLAWRERQASRFDSLFAVPVLRLSVPSRLAASLAIYSDPRRAAHTVRR